MTNDSPVDIRWSSADSTPSLASTRPASQPRDRLPAPLPAGPERVLSIDALRGFDMFWIIGGREVVRAWAKWLDSPWYPEIDRQFTHVRWEGFVFYDLIFPLFLFLVGAVLPFSLGKLRDRGEPNSRLYGRILRRTLMLFALGLLYNRILDLNWETFRFSGVLQRIALCYGIAAVLVVHTSVSVQAIVLAALLLGYWALLAWVPVPGGSAGDYSMQGSLPGWVDRHYMPGRVLYYGYGDNEGILSTIPAIGTALLGVLAGQWLRSARGPWTKVAGLVGAGIACLSLALVWDRSFPIIKNIWTSSYVLYAGGWSLLLLAMFYGVIDVLGYRRWAYFFVVIGANAILIYAALKFIDFGYTTRFLFGGLARHVGSFEPVLLPMGLVAVEWFFLWILYRNRVFFRV